MDDQAKTVEEINAMQYTGYLYTYPTITPAVCPTCGTCPTCGKRLGVVYTQLTYPTTVNQNIPNTQNYHDVLMSTSNNGRS